MTFVILKFIHTVLKITMKPKPNWQTLLIIDYVLFLFRTSGPIHIYKYWTWWHELKMSYSYDISSNTPNNLLQMEPICMSQIGIYPGEKLFFRFMSILSIFYKRCFHKIYLDDLSYPIIHVFIIQLTTLELHPSWQVFRTNEYQKNELNKQIRWNHLPSCLE